MADIEQARSAFIARVRDGEGTTPSAQRRAAFDNVGLEGPLARLVDKVANASSRVTDEDVAQVRASGLSEDQVFELVVAAAVGQAARNNANALAALAAAQET